MKSLVVIPSRYPCRAHPTWHVFVRQIAHSFARQGVAVTVVSPLPFHRAWRGGDPYRAEEDAGDGARVTVFRPRILSWSSLRIGRWNTFGLTVGTMTRAVRRVIRREMPALPDALYGHFMYPAGAVAVRLGTDLGVPAFPAAGEISLDTIDALGPERARRDLVSACAFVANSEHLAGLMRDRLALGADRIGVFPNGIDRRIFRPLDRAGMRQRFGLPADRTLVGFVGGFEPRKGARRVAAAIEGLDGVAGVYVGSGDEAPTGGQVAFCGRLPHGDIPAILSACDMFALPTSDEGCCNAILEALACGLPVISSTGAFNDEILTPAVSIRVEAMDVAALRAAILRLRDDRPGRTAMGAAALDWSERFDIDGRAQRMLAFMRAHMGEGAGRRAA